MGQRRDRLDNRLAKAKATRQVNSLKKEKERNRREKQMMSILKTGQVPYTPAVMSWLSAKLDKKASNITETDISSVISCSN